MTKSSKKIILSEEEEKDKVTFRTSRRSSWSKKHIYIPRIGFVNIIERVLSGVVGKLRHHVGVDAGVNHDLVG